MSTDATQHAQRAAFLAEPLLARLATATADGQPHVVPVWFLWDGERIWISSYSSTRKIRELRANPRCSVVIDVPEPRHGLTAVLVEGDAQLHSAGEFARTMATRIYTRYLGPDGVLAADPQEWIHAAEQTIIEVAPRRIKQW
jgi:PPOX class probable F420-dependent enzyme